VLEGGGEGEYGMDVGGDGFWGAVLGPLLEGVACANGKARGRQ